jgi:hypothetical protein
MIHVLINGRVMTGCNRLTNWFLGMEIDAGDCALVARQLKTGMSLDQDIGSHAKPNLVENL